MHIHPSSPNSDIDPSLQTEESAAIKIQAGFRGYRVRKQLQHQGRDTSNGYHNHHQSHYQHSSPQRQQQQQQLTVHSSNGNRTIHPATTEAIGNSSGNMTAELGGGTVADRCATKIQAGVRGFLVRKKQKIAADAATKIQASFRGFKARKETQRLKQK